MAERPDEYELDDYPERRYGEDTDYPTDQRELKFFQENSLRNESYKSFRTRQQFIESNRVGVRTSFLDGRKSEIKVLKRNILSDILDIPYDEIDETKFDLKIEPVDIETYKLYYKNRPLVEYNAKYDRLRVISADDVNLFKTKYVNETIYRYSEKEMKSDFSVKSDLSALDLEVRQSESEEYHRKIDSLEREVSSLRQSQNDSIEKDREIERLKDELERTKVDTDDNQIEAIKENLKLKSVQLIESQKEIESLRENIENLEDEIRSNKLKNIDELNIELNRNSEEYEKKLDEIRRQRDFYKSKEDELRKKLVENLDSKQEDIRSSIEQINKAYKERDESISFQESLRSKISELEKALKKYEDSYIVEKTISEDRKLELDKARNEIKELENKVNESNDFNTSMMETRKRKVESLKTIIETNKKYIKSQENLLEDRKKYFFLKLLSQIYDRLEKMCEHLLY